MKITISGRWAIHLMTDEAGVVACSSYHRCTCTLLPVGRRQASPSSWETPGLGAGSGDNRLLPGWGLLRAAQHSTLPPRTAWAVSRHCATPFAQHRALFRGQSGEEVLAPLGRALYRHVRPAMGSSRSTSTCLSYTPAPRQSSFQHLIWIPPQRPVSVPGHVLGLTAARIVIAPPTPRGGSRGTPRTPLSLAFTLSTVLSLRVATRGT